MSRKGKVYLIGAGPGDPGLLTLRAAEVLREANATLYDNLASKEILTLCLPECETIYVGKEAGDHHVSQERTIGMMIERARKGEIVCRLKGGDPFIFGRGGEEAAALKAAEVDYEIVPGVTAALGAAAYAGIPLTYRSNVTQCVFLTAHEAPGKETSQVQWKKLAKLENTTIVVYMGVSTAGKAADELMKGGMFPSMPVAIVENATSSRQRTINCKLLNLKEIVVAKKVRPPALFIIGPTAGMNSELSWFDRKPLFGKRIVVTRAKDQAKTLTDLLAKQGAEPYHLPTIRTSLKAEETEHIEKLTDNRYDWIVFSSENGVRYFFEYLEQKDLDARALSGSKIAVIGSGTALRLSGYGLRYDFMPKSFTSHSLTKEMAEKYDLDGAKVLRVKGYFSEDPLSDRLVEFGAEVDKLQVYDIEREDPDPESVKKLLEIGAQAVIFTSKSTVENFFDILGDKIARNFLLKARPTAIGPVTKSALDEKDVGAVIQADTHTIRGIVDKLCDKFGD